MVKKGINPPETLLKAEGIERRLGVSGGDACIVNTRIPVWALVRYRQLGASESDLLQCYPTLTLDDLNHAWEYYHARREEIEGQIRANEVA